MPHSRRNSVALTAAAAFACLFFYGCRAPMAATTYPTIVDDGLEGLWELSLESENPSPDPAQRAYARISLIDEPSGFFEKLFSAVEQSRLAHDSPIYQIELLWGNDSEESSLQMTLEGTLINTNSVTLITLQGSAEETRWLSTPLVVPLQYTLRYNRDLDQIVISGHQHTLLWIPIQSAEPSRGPISPGAENTPLLVDDFDKIIQYYSKSPDQDWRPLIRARRIKKIPASSALSHETD